MPVDRDYSRKPRRVSAAQGETTFDRSCDHSFDSPSQSSFSSLGNFNIFSKESFQGLCLVVSNCIIVSKLNYFMNSFINNNNILRLVKLYIKINDKSYNIYKFS